MVHESLRRKLLSADVGAFVFACVAAVVFTWPLAANASDHILRASYGWDAYTNAMILGSRVDGWFGRGPLGLFDDYYFAPLPNSIVFNENHFGLSLLFAPFYLLGNNPLLAYNLTLLLSLALSVFFTYLLVRRLAGSAEAGLLAGVAFAFSPYVVFEFATQWIPACFYFLHRAVEGRRARDIVGFWVAYLLELGTCLYYAMFLVPLLLAVGLATWLSKRPPRRTLFVMLGVGALAGALALTLLHPYFSERKNFDLERSLAFAASYDGKLAFFGNVPQTNLGLPWLHHADKPRGAYEEIAFPGFTVLGLAAFALVTAGARAVARRGARAAALTAACVLGVLALATLATFAFQSMLAGAVALVVAGWLYRRALARAGMTRGLWLYVAVLCLAVLLFLGIEPCVWRGRPVHGHYYYLYTYVPGYDGIRKVSRQAVMTTFLAAVVAGFGGAALFSRLKTSVARVSLFVGLLATSTLELRAFPHPLEAQWAGASVPAVYRFLATLPQRDLLAVVPQNEGLSRFRGDAGMALHNYLALYHKHRFVDGQSSFTPPVTDLVERALSELPSEGAHAVLRAVGADHLLIHGADLPEHGRSLIDGLLARPAEYRRIYREGDDAVFTLLDAGGRRPSLATVPALPPSARRLAREELVPSAALEAGRARFATDGDPRSFWSSRTPQAAGQAFELGLAAPHRVVALEIENPRHEMFLPMSYVLEASLRNGPSRVVAREPELVLDRTQIYAPKQFVFRIVLSEPVEADELRLVVDRPLPGIDFVVHEAHVYVAPDETAGAPTSPDAAQ